LVIKKHTIALPGISYNIDRKHSGHRSEKQIATNRSYYSGSKEVKMNKNKNTSFSLLSQQEIDTLVKFLTDKKNTVDSDVMNQNSIDKLIHLIRTDKEHFILNPFLSLSYAGMDIAYKLQFRTDESEICELRCAIDQTAKSMKLVIYNTEKDTSFPLSTDMFDENDTAGWGAAISPSLFCQVAYALSLKFSQETYDFVCNAFAKLNYGSEEHKISEVYLPDSNTLVASLL